MEDGDTYRRDGADGTGYHAGSDQLYVKEREHPRVRVLLLFPLKVLVVLAVGPVPTPFEAGFGKELEAEVVVGDYNNYFGKT